MIIEYLEDLPLGQFMAVLAVLAAIVMFFRKTYPWMARVKDFMDDLMGEPARKGVEPRPGLIERMAIAEKRLQCVEYNSKPNGGGSAHDDLMREIRTVGNRLEDHIRDTT